MKTCSIGVLSYNEAKNIPEVVKDLITVFKELKASNISGNIVIIDNGSTDNTKDVISKLEKENDCVSHITIDKNQGYGFGLKKYLNIADNDINGFIWGDNQFDANIVKEMIKEFDNKEVNIVKTYRRKRYDGQYRIIISTIYQTIFRLIHGGKIKDINSGPKLFRKNVLHSMLPLKSDDWFIDAEMMIFAVKNYNPKQIVELPINFFPRKFGKSNVKFSVAIEFFINLIKAKISKL